MSLKNESKRIDHNKSFLIYSRFDWQDIWEFSGHITWNRSCRKLFWCKQKLTMFFCPFLKPIRVEYHYLFDYLVQCYLITLNIFCKVLLIYLKSIWIVSNLVSFGGTTKSKILSLDPIWWGCYWRQDLFGCLY